MNAPRGRAILEPELTSEELLRYARHISIPEVGRDGQQRLGRARVLMVGAGGLGSPAAMYLAAAGVGEITVIDHDVVDTSNLQRQLLHGTADVGRRKVDSARERLAAINPRVHVEAVADRIAPANARPLVAAHDLVIDGSDNFATRYLVNDACVLEGKPDVYASVFRFEGQASVFAARSGPCYRCLFPAPPPAELVPSCAEAGVLGVVPGLLGMVQATEALKLLLGVGESLVGRLLLVDALGMSLRTVPIRRDPGCAMCGAGATGELGRHVAECGAPGLEATVPEISPGELASRLDARDELVLLDVREPWEWAEGHLTGATNAPLASLEATCERLDPRMPTVVYCRSGVRSTRAAAELRRAGFDEVRTLSGGLDRWRQEGRAMPTIRAAALGDREPAGG